MSEENQFMMCKRERKKDTYEIRDYIGAIWLLFAPEVRVRFDLIHFVSSRNIFQSG